MSIYYWGFRGLQKRHTYIFHYDCAVTFRVAVERAAVDLGSSPFTNFTHGLRLVQLTKNISTKQSESILGR
jgi:hypothetical protein